MLPIVYVVPKVAYIKFISDWYFYRLKVTFTTLVMCLTLLTLSALSSHAVANTQSLTSQAQHLNSHPNPHQNIVDLLKAGQQYEAYLLAKQHVDEWEGDPKFDLAFGLAAKASGDLEQAVFSFERVLDAAPLSADVRYFLAVSYFEMKNYTAAQSQFEVAKREAKSEKLQVQISQYQRVLTAKLSKQSGNFTNWISVGGGYDDNANNGADAEFVFFPTLGNIRLFEQSQAVESAYSQIQFQTVYQKPINQQSRLYAAAHIRYDNFDESLAWSRTFVNASLGGQTYWLGLDWDVSIFTRPIWLDSDSYVNYNGLKVSSEYALSQAMSLGADLSFAGEQDKANQLLDKTQRILALWFTYSSGSNLLHRYSVRVGQEEVDDSGFKFHDRDLSGMSYSLNWFINNQWQFTTNLDYLIADHQADDPLFIFTREDRLTRVNIKLSHEFTNKWQGLLGMTYLDNDSNLTLYDYKRSSVLLSVKYSF